MTLQAVKMDEPMINKIGTGITQAIENGEAKVLGFFNSQAENGGVGNWAIMAFAGGIVGVSAGREIIGTYPGYVISGVAQNDDKIIGDIIKFPDGTSTMVYA